jgi:hypothetical protein
MIYVKFKKIDNVDLSTIKMVMWMYFSIQYTQMTIICLVFATYNQYVVY